MNTILKSSNGLTLVPLESRLLAERKLFLEGEITAASACAFVRAMMLLVQENAEKPIDIYLNSPGGEVNAGLVLYDVLKSAKTEINLHCVGLAASMAAILLAGGQKGHRFILRHSKIMIHEPLIACGVGGSATSIRRTAESILETKQMSVELLAADTGRSEEEIEAAIAFDNYMNAEEAIAFGICDTMEASIF
jgi:ATP-dependent Clp protease protease subunit